MTERRGVRQATLAPDRRPAPIARLSHLVGAHPVTASLTLGLTIYLGGGLALLFIRPLPKSWSEVSFFVGPLVESLLAGQGYRTCVHSLVNGEVCYYAQRMPTLPLIYYKLSILAGNSMLIVYIVRNILLGVLLSLAFAIFSKSAGKSSLSATLSAAATFIIFPYLTISLFSWPVEETFLVPQIALVFCIVALGSKVVPSQHQNLVIGLIGGALNGSLFLTKSSMIILVVSNSMMVFMKGRGLARITFVSVSLVILLAWGAFSYVKTGYLVIGSSTDGWNLWKGNNEFTDMHYPIPGTMLDVLDSSHPLELPVMKISGYDNEWKADAFWKERAISYMLANPYNTMERTAKKFFTLLIDPRRISPSKQPKWAEHLVFLGNLLFRGVFWYTMFLGMHVICRGHPSKSVRDTAILFIVFVISFAAPYMIGFAYTRHFLPLIFPTVFTCFVIVQDRRLRQT